MSKATQMACIFFIWELFIDRFQLISVETESLPIRVMDFTEKMKLPSGFGLIDRQTIQIEIDSKLSISLRKKEFFHSFEIEFRFLK